MKNFKKSANGRTKQPFEGNRHAVSRLLKVKQITVALLAVYCLSGCTKMAKQATPDNDATSTNAKLETQADQVFRIAVLPDTQQYLGEREGGTLDMFKQQIQWIRDHKADQNIAYVVHLGDVVQGGDVAPQQWANAATELYKLGIDSIPFGVAVGNHDQGPWGTPAGTANGYGVYFGKAHMQTYPWYKGCYGASGTSDNHYDFFTAMGTNYMVLYLEYNSPDNDAYNHYREGNVMDWADSILNLYPNRKAIIVCHNILQKPVGSNSDIQAGGGNNAVAAQYTAQGQIIYDRMKHHNNVFLMLCGHISGEGFRTDTFNGHVIKSYLCDYQARRNSPFGENDGNGGNGLMRLMKFNLTDGKLSVSTFAPRTPPTPNITEEDVDSDFYKDLYN